MEDLRPGLNAAGTLLKLGRLRQAAALLESDDLSSALVYNIEAYPEVLSLTRAFFSDGWTKQSPELDYSIANRLRSTAAVALGYSNEPKAAIPVLNASILSHLERKNWTEAAAKIYEIAWCFREIGILASATRLDELALECATLTGDRTEIFICRFRLFRDLALGGRWVQAEAAWKLLDKMGRAWPRNSYRPGEAEYHFALLKFWRGALREEHLAAAARLTAEGRNTRVIRQVHALRSRWCLDKEDWALAAASMSEAVRMSRAVGLVEATCETGLALAKLHLRQLAEPQHAAGRLAQLRDPEHYYLAQLWSAIGDTAQARHHALAAYKKAWADGEPYVRRYDLTRATELLGQLNVSLPDLPAYDPSRDPRFPWEADVGVVIQKLKANRKSNE